MLLPVVKLRPMTDTMHLAPIALTDLPPAVQSFLLAVCAANKLAPEQGIVKILEIAAEIAAAQPTEGGAQ